MKLPKEIQEFISKGVELENYCLPHFYPELDSFEDFQIGYKVNGVSGEKETGTKEGDFKEAWYVICSAYANDPFFIDITEMNKNFPVYFAWHGAGKWTAIKVAENISDFSNKIKLLKDLETSNDDIRKEFKKNFDVNNEFWKEVYDGYEEEEEFNSAYQSPTEQEKRIHEINKALIVLKEDKQKGTITLKNYLVMKRELADEMHALKSNIK
ncbi:SMI1/KNR4 family protein [Aquimarina sp. 2201CG14-23]|uniref:SMI1/KNR4 family protein n=1 Tax=Aquimarina mycalae TaxID=3040073 RepID=UPI0024781264|nr:SMI1/KNR4 family protein [Aquimarina sp. 2201CG14-23]MDH7444806.1 SMI1/KNR4 family protein [Aquimarina sp. 2201CG14-23]